ncbi:MAG: helix-turn-helix domain-containing protein [Nanoarchaeota archaeon]
MELTFLEGLGLTSNEIKVYTCIAQQGQLGPTEIAKNTKLHRPNVYDALARLVDKGFLSQVILSDTKYYEIANPHVLIDMLKEKEQQIQNMIPQMLLSQKINGNKNTIRLNEGIYSLRQFFRKCLEIKEPIYTFGIPQEIDTWIGEAFIREFHEERVRRMIEMSHIYGSDAQKRVAYLNTLSYTKAGYVPGLTSSKTFTMVCGNFTTFSIFSVNPWLVIEIENPDLAEANRKYFGIMYTQCKSK